MRRTNANPFFFSRTTAKKKWRLFPLSVDLRWRKRHERHQQKARNNAKKNNSRDNNNNTTTTSRQVLFLMLCFCVPFVCSSPKQPLFYTRELLLLRVVFLVWCRPLGGNWTNDTKLNNTQRIICFQKNDTNVSLSVCVFLLEQQQVEVVFLSASKSSSVLRRSSFVVKGKERLKNETLLESRVQTRMWMRRRSLDWVETEIRTWHQQRQRQTPEWDDVFRSKTDGTRRDLFTSLC